MLDPFTISDATANAFLAYSSILCTSIVTARCYYNVNSVLYMPQVDLQRIKHCII